MRDTSDVVMAGRPRKYKGEETDTLTVRVPLSLLGYLGNGDLEDSTTQRERAFRVLLFERALTEELQDLLTDVRISSAKAGLGYEENRAEAIARLVKLGLECEKKGKK